MSRSGSSWPARRGSGSRALLCAVCPARLHRAVSTETAVGLQILFRRTANRWTRARSRRIVPGCDWVVQMANDKPRAGFAAQEAWAEMDTFLNQCEAVPAMTDEERVQLLRRFLEIQERCNAKILAIFRSCRRPVAPFHTCIWSARMTRRISVFRSPIVGWATTRAGQPDARVIVRVVARRNTDGAETRQIRLPQASPRARRHGARL